MASQAPPTPTRTSPPRYKLDPQAPLETTWSLCARCFSIYSALCRVNI